MTAPTSPDDIFVNGKWVNRSGNSSIQPVQDAQIGSLVRNASSAVNAYADVRSVGYATMLTASMTDVAIGAPGSISAAASDTHVMRLVVGAATLGGVVTIKGFQDIAGNAVSLTFAATLPFGVYELGHILNDKGQLLITTGAGLTAASTALVTRPA